MVPGSNPAVVTLMLCVVPLDELRVLKLHCLRPHSRCSWELTCDGLVSHPGYVNYSHSLSTTETRGRRQPYAASWLEEGFNYFQLTACKRMQYPLVPFVLPCTQHP